MSKMRGWCAAGLVAVTVAALATVALAEEEDIAFTPGDAISSISLGNVSFRAGTFNISCPITMSGSFDTDAMPLLGGTQLGEISRFQVGERSCSGGTISSALGLESGWDIDYAAVLGIFPDALTGLQTEVSGAALLISSSEGTIRCLYAEPLDLLLGLSFVEREESNYYDGRLLTSLRNELAYRSGSERCARTATLAGTFSQTPAQQVMPHPAAALLQATPTSLTIRREQLNSTFRLRNIGEAVARPLYGVIMSSGPEFAVVGPGCSIIVRQNTCTWTVTPADPRPAAGRIRISWEEGFNNYLWLIVEVIIETP